jgi:hypothetical protein
MPEGLDPIETGKELHEHGETAHRPAGNGDGHGGAGDRHSRIIQIGEAILLALVTLTAAWAGLRGGKVGHRIACRHCSVLEAAQPGYPRRPRGPVAPQFRRLDLQRMVHRVHPQ